MKRHRLPRQSTAGFTLIELLVIIVIVGVLFAIAAPGWLAFMNRQRLGRANEQIFQTIRTAQIEAKRTRTYREARFDNNSGSPRVAVLPLTASTSGTGGQQVMTLTPLSNTQVNTWQNLGQGDVKSGTLTLTENNPNGSGIIFNPDGAVASQTQATTNPSLSSTPIFSVTLALTQSSSVKQCVQVQTLLGAISQASNASCP